jgi:hypothetical protein
LRLVQRGFADRYILFAINDLVLDGLRANGAFFILIAAPIENAGWLGHGCMRLATGRLRKAAGALGEVMLWT